MKHKNTFIFSKILDVKCWHLRKGTSDKWKKKREPTTLAARESWWFCSVLSASLLSFAFFPAISCPVQSSSQRMSVDQQKGRKKRTLFSSPGFLRNHCVQYCPSIFRRVKKSPLFKVKDKLTSLGFSCIFSCKWRLDKLGKCSSYCLVTLGVAVRPGTVGDRILNVCLTHISKLTRCSSKLIT